MPSLLARLPASNGFTATRHAVSLPIGLDVGVAIPQMPLAACRGIVLAPLVLGSGNHFEMIGPDTVPHAAQVIDFHPIGDNDSPVVEERPMRRPVSLTLVADSVGVSVVAEAGDPQPACVSLVNTGEEPLLGGPEPIHAHEWQSTTGRYCA